MAIHLSNNLIPATAPYGTVVGLLSDNGFVAVSFSILFGIGGLFGISGTKLVTRWMTPPQPTNYQVLLLARGGGFFQFDIGVVTITVTPSTPETGSFNPTTAVISTPGKE